MEFDSLSCLTPRNNLYSEDAISTDMVMQQNLDLMNEILQGLIDKPSEYSVVVNLEEQRSRGINLGMPPEWFDDCISAPDVVCLNVTEDEIYAHLRLLEDAGFIQMGKYETLGPTYRPTLDGHEYIAATKQRGLLDKARVISESTGLVWQQMPIRQIFEIMAKNWFTG